MSSCACRNATAINKYIGHGANSSLTCARIYKMCMRVYARANVIYADKNR